MASEGCLCRPSLRLDAYYYGRGAEIWPPPIDGDKPLDLADSFPNRIVPPEAALASLEIATSSNDNGATASDPSPETWTKASVMNSITRRILRRAAARDENGVTAAATTNQATTTLQAFLSNVPKVPGILALLLVMFRFVTIADLLGVTLVSGYVALLGMASQLKRPDGITPACPGLPPQGHVPLLVRIPLSPATVESREFGAWLRMAALFGLVQPVVAALHHLASTSSKGFAAPTSASLAAAQLLLRPVFWACCQLVTERASRRTFPALPLPIRILVPVLYNSVRIPLLWECAISPYWGGVGRTFAFLNLAFWSVNLFGFLLPVATMRYLRAHFFMVEAEQVTLRPGMEETIGLPQ
jgi:hypothetical protein